MSKKESKTKNVKNTHSDQIEETVDLAADTLKGDVRAFLLDRLRNFSKPYAAMSEAEQQRAIEHADSAAETLIRNVCKVIAAEGRKAMMGKLESVTVKDGLKAVIKLSRKDEARHDLIDCQGAEVLIVVADVEPFTGEREPAKADPDQKALPIDEEEEPEEDGEGEAVEEESLAVTA